MEAAAAAPPPSTAAAAPLPFLGDDIFVLIAAELDARMLGRLGCAAQRFWRPSVPDPAHKADDPAPPELWSVAEEGARRRLCAQSEQVRGWVCRGGVGGSWLRALGEAEKLQRPLAFTAHHETINLSEEGAVAARVVDLLSWGGAVCGGHEMRRGRHYATFTLRSMSYSIRPSTPSGIMFGVVGPTFNPTSDELAHRSSPAWMMYTDTGNLWCCREEPAENDSGWEGQPTTGELKEGDVVGLLLDLDAATLTVWVNGERKGVMVRLGMTFDMPEDDHHGEPVPRLEGPLRWAVDLDVSSVAIGGPLPPPESAAQP